MLHARAGRTSDSLYASPTGSQSGAKSFVAVEASKPVFEVLYHYGRVDAAANGAYDRM